MATQNNRASDEAEIRALMNDRVKAVRAKDINGALSNVALDLLSFDVVNSLQTVGSGAARKCAADWSTTFQGSIWHEIHDLSITTGDDVAFSHSANRVVGTMTDGKKIDIDWRNCWLPQV